MDKINLPIGVFDSGVGGISVLRQLRKLLPKEDFLYFGDCANAPYGTREMADVRELTLQAARWFFDQGIKALVVACNTATGAAIAALREEYPDEIIIGIEPAVMLAEHTFPAGRLGVMATPLTLHQEKYLTLISHIHSDVVSIPVTGLVELVEQGKGNAAEAEALLSKLLAPYAGKLDALVLGCTHYPFAAHVIEKLLPGTTLMDGGEGTARETLRRLRLGELLKTEGIGKTKFCFSKHERLTRALAMQLLQADIPEHL